MDLTIGFFLNTTSVGNSPEFSYDLISPSVGETNIIYEIAIILVKLQTYYEYPNSHLSRG
jgi:hypothetical protein